MWRSTVPPSEDAPNGRTHVLAVCATLGQLDYFVALALQQHGEQSALRKGRGHNFLFSLSKRWTIFAGIPFIPCGRVATPRPDKSTKFGLYSSCARCNNCVWALPKRSAPQPEKQSKKNGDALISGREVAKLTNYVRNELRPIWCNLLIDKYLLCEPAVGFEPTTC